MSTRLPVFAGRVKFIINGLSIHLVQRKRDDTKWKVNSIKKIRDCDRLSAFKFEKELNSNAYQKGREEVQS
jgi:hypothetical protein